MGIFETAYMIYKERRNAHQIYFLDVYVTNLP